MFHKTVDITQLKDLHRLNGNASIDYLFLPFFLITYMCVWSAWSLLLNIANKYLLTSYINVQELIVDWEVIADWTIVHKPFHPVAKDIYGSPHYPLSLRCCFFFHCAQLNLLEPLSFCERFVVIVNRNSVGAWKKWSHCTISFSPVIQTLTVLPAIIIKYQTFLEFSFELNHIF